MLLKWKNKYSTEIELIDKQHKMIIILYNQLVEARNSNISQNMKNNFLNRMLDYVKYHLKFEEMWLKKYYLKQYHRLKYKHFTMEKRVINLQYDTALDNFVLTPKDINHIKSWIKSHMLEFDEDFRLFVKGLINNKLKSKEFIDRNFFLN